MAKINLKHTGFTLVETVIAAGMVGLLSVALVNIFFSTVQGGDRSRMEADIKSQGDFAITSMERNLRNAIVMPVCLDVPPTPPSLAFTVKDDLGTFQTYTYEHNGDTITLDVNGTNKGSVLSPDVRVDLATFTCESGSGINPGKVIIRLELTVLGEGGKSVSNSFQTTVTMRNQL